MTETAIITTGKKSYKPAWPEYGVHTKQWHRFLPKSLPLNNISYFHGGKNKINIS